MAFLVSFVGVPEAWRASVASVAGAVALSVGVVALPAPQAEAAVVAEPAPVVDPAAVPRVAADSASAQVNARLAGERVEDLSQRTVESSTFALPDGSWQSVISPGPVWVRTGGDGTREDDWAPVDASLTERKDGSWRPVAHPGDVVVSGGGTGTEGDPVVVARVTDPATGVVSELSWPGDLPEPVVAGPRATFADVAPGTDMVVDVTGTGVEQFFVLHEAPADPDGVVLPVGVAAAGTVASEPATAAVQFATEDDQVAAVVATPMMWDQVADAQRAHPVTEPVEEASEPDMWAVDVADEEAPAGQAARATGEADPLDAGVAAEVPLQVEVDGDSAALTLVPGEGFLADPDVVYPVVIDPSIGLTISHDTWVQSDTTVSKASDPELRVGTHNGSVRARSFLHVITNPIKGKKVTSAYLKLYQFHSYSCSNRQFQVWSTGLSTTSTVWSNQPSWSNQWAATTDTKGYSSACAAGWTTINITDLADAWSTNSPNYQAIGLKATDETDPYGWKKFRSSDATSGKPTVTINYNSYPNTPATTRHTSAYNWWPSSSDPNRVLYVRTLNPRFSATVSDPDGGNVRGQWDILDGSNLVWNKVPGYLVASGGTSNVGSSGAALTNGRSYMGQVWSFDGSLRSKSSKAITPFTVDVTAPATPTISASGYTNNEWKDSRPGENVFTFTSSSTDAVKFEVTYDGKKKTLNPGARTTTWDWNPGQGAHTVSVKAIDKAGWPSGERTYNFGHGGMQLTGPKDGTKSTDFTTTATGPAPATGSAVATTYYRVAGQSDTSDSLPDGSASNASGWEKIEGSERAFNGQYSHTWSGDIVAMAESADRKILTFDVQVCVTYTIPAATRCTWNGSPESLRPTLVRLPRAFGESYPVVEAGPGQVALWTGEFSTSDSASAGDLSVSRHYSSMAKLDEHSPFGPGWAASFGGPEFGVAGMEVQDSTGIDGTISLTSENGEPLVYRQPGEGRELRKSGRYAPADSLTAEYGARLSIAPSGLTLTFVEEDGSRTTFDYDQPLGKWLATSTEEAASDEVATFQRNAQGNVTRILAPVAEGTACGDEELLDRGCRALQIEYGSSGPGAEKVVAIRYRAWDPTLAGGAMRTATIAQYTYDTSGRLMTAADPRSGVSVTYEYAEGVLASGDSQPLLTRVEPSGMAAYAFHYSSTSEVQGAGRLLAVERAPAVANGSSVTINRYLYDIDPTSLIPGLPVMDTSVVARWGQETPPGRGFATFTADAPHIGTEGLIEDIEPLAVPAGAWKFAEVLYTDADGRVVNTASHAAGAWRIAATTFDDHGRVARVLDARAVGQLEQLNSELALSTEEINSYATITRYAAGEPDPFGHSRVTDTWLPAVENGDRLVRVRVHTEYDEEAPAGGIHPDTESAFGLPTTVTTMEVDGLSGSPNPDDEADVEGPVISQERMGYNPLDGSSSLSATSGWMQGQPTRRSIVRGTDIADIVFEMKYDELGREIERRQPGSSGGDAGTTITSFYSAEPQSGPNAQCGNKAEWAGLLCMTRSAESLPSVPTEQVAMYSYYLDVAETIEALDDVSRTTKVSYDSAGRQSTLAYEVVGLPNSEPVAATRTEYDAESGLPNATVSLNQSGLETSRVTTSYDRWGNATQYVDVDGLTTTTQYDAAGRVTSVIDGTGREVEYLYGSSTESRSVVTTKRVSGVGVFTAEYDLDGNIVSETMPGGVTREQSFDRRSGELTGLSYVDGVATGAENPRILDWSMERDLLGRLELMTSSASKTSNPEDSDAGASDSSLGLARLQKFEYDRASRLIEVTDWAGESCTSREYTFDLRGRRVSATEADRGEDCSSTGVTSSRGWAYDEADRVLASGSGIGNYLYDALGRQLSIPADDAPASSTHGDVAIEYFDTDAVRSISQGGVTTVFSLDPQGRRNSEKTASSSGTSEVVRHYSDYSDNPAWVEDIPASGVATTTWFGSSISGELGIQIVDEIASLTLSDPLGSIITTSQIGGVSEPTQIGDVNLWDEYGNQLRGAATAMAYGWLGAHERATSGAGLVLMGERLYNPRTGLFTSVDSVRDGNVTRYAYPVDPINQIDLDGRVAQILGGAGVILALLALGAALIVVVYINEYCRRYPCSLRIPRFSFPRYNGPKVPLPKIDSTTAKKFANTKYYVYKIFRLSNGAVYKYGITRVTGAKRPKSQINSCTAYFRSTCTYKWMAITKGWYNARMIEAGYIFNYALKHGKCPPGQAVSCR